ncbi:MAG: molybdate ABC transporter permease subunit [Gammaproteobacteria bacterium]
MDWTAFGLSLKLSACTIAVLLVLGLAVARSLAWRRFPGRSLVEAVVALPLVLPPTVLGYYLLLFLGRQSPLGLAVESLTGETLVFSFSGLLIASVIYSFPFATQPMLQAFESIPQGIREAAWCSGLSKWQAFWRIELPLARNGVVSGLALSFAHTLGEFGVVLMVGGNIPGRTRTVSIAIFDQVQAFEEASAGAMSLVLLIFSLGVVALVYMLNRNLSGRWHD